MASAPSEPRPVLGRLDGAGRLIAADPELEILQRQAGSNLGEALAIPQIAAVARLARKLGMPVSRPALAASIDHDIELWVQARPEGEETALSLEGWTVRAPAGPRLAAILGGEGEAQSGGARNEWAADEELHIISLSPDLADLLGVSPDEVAGEPLTRIVRLEEDASGEMPLISGLAARRSFSGQLARSRADDGRSVTLSGEVVTGGDGTFAGFRGTMHSDGVAPSTAPRSSAFDQALDEVLRSPLDRIIESAERIVERADGPLRSDYASYGKDIAAAARHLLSVLTSMSEGPLDSHRAIDLAALAGEAVVMLDSSAEEQRVRIDIEPRGEALLASGEQRAALQILVNLVGNAIRYSPPEGSIRLRFEQTPATVSVTVADEGPGIAATDQQRIFERFERAHAEQGGSGLGLAISRRLARSMGGDVTVDSTPGEGARFTLTLPAA